MQYGNVKNGAGRILPSGKADWSQKRPPKGARSAFTTHQGATKRDSTRTKHVERYAPELMQVARAFGIHPREVLAKLRYERKLNELKTFIA